jgi:4-amino-4-deoxy-L-arabinose transferase-like glycosyltransferase
LGIDEAYTVATARSFALSTYDHPPLAWWLAGGARWLFGTEAALAVRLPFMALFALSTWLMFALTRLLFGSRAGLLAALTLNFAPVLAWSSGTFVLPDGPLLAALLAGAYCLARVFFTSGRPALWWLAAGACGGIACLSKLHGVFLFAGTGLFLLTVPAQRRWLLTPWPYLGALVAVVLFTPVLIWNAQHDWASFAFQGGRARLVHLDPLAPLAVLAGHAAFFLPWLWVPLVVSFTRALVKGPRDERAWLLACLGAGPIVVFTLVAVLGSKVLYHWSAPGYLFLFGLLGRDLASLQLQHARRARVWLASTATSLVVLLGIVVALAKLPWPPVVFPKSWSATLQLGYPLAETVSWRELESALSRRGLLAERKLFIAATRWHEAGRIDLALHGRWPVLCLCHDGRGFGILQRPADHAGETALIIGPKLSKAGIEAGYAACFDSIEELAPVPVHQGGEPLLELKLFRGRGFSPGGSLVCGSKQQLHDSPVGPRAETDGAPIER